MGRSTGHSDSEDPGMPFVALAVALLLARPVYGGTCSGTVPNDVCEAGRPAPTCVRRDLVGKGRRRARRGRSVEAATLPQGPRGDLRRGVGVAVRQSTEATPAGLKKLSTELVRVNAAGEIHVYVVLTEWSPEHIAALEALGLRVEATVPTRHLIQGWVPGGALDDVAALDAVKEVKPPGVRHA